MVRTMNLNEYLEHSGISPENFALLVGVHGTTVRRWLDGAPMRDDHMVRVIEASGKKITAAALLKEARRRGHAA